MITVEIVETLFIKPDEWSLIDVRSPSEFKRGHIPGAHNIPLFSDQVRAIVGKIYVNEGKERAMHVAMEHLGPHLTELVDQAKKIYRLFGGKTLCVYCARGGMRSGSVAWLFNLFQLPVVQLDRGYKAYRNWVLAQFTKRRSIMLLSGKTGSGKTELLRRMSKRGKQVIDLEGLACHKGSVFGGSKDKQPTQQQFENDLAWQWAQLDLDIPVWLEGESRKIGSVIIPEGVWLQMQKAPIYLLEKPREERIKRIMSEYGFLDKSFLLKAVEELKDHLGSARCCLVKRNIEKNSLVPAIELLLAYYDAKYDHGLKQKKALIKLQPRYTIST